MKNSRAAGIAIALFCTVTLSETITLQQGVNSYTGCSDTYITRHYAKVASGYATAKTISTAYANYNWLGGGW